MGTLRVTPLSKPSGRAQGLEGKSSKDRAETDPAAPRRGSGEGAVGDKAVPPRASRPARHPGDTRDTGTAGLSAPRTIRTPKTPLGFGTPPPLAQQGGAGAMLAAGGGTGRRDAVPSLPASERRDTGRGDNGALTPPLSGALPIPPRHSPPEPLGEGN